jgi:hypothetical protein
VLHRYMTLNNLFSLSLSLLRFQQNSIHEKKSTSFMTFLHLNLLNEINTQQTLNGASEREKSSMNFRMNQMMCCGAKIIA